MGHYPLLVEGIGEWLLQLGSWSTSWVCSWGSPARGGSWGQVGLGGYSPTWLLGSPPGGLCLPQYPHGATWWEQGATHSSEQPQASHKPGTRSPKGSSKIGALPGGALAWGITHQHTNSYSSSLTHLATCGAKHSNKPQAWGQVGVCSVWLPPPPPPPPPAPPPPQPRRHKK